MSKLEELARDWRHQNPMTPGEDFIADKAFKAGFEAACAMLEDPSEDSGPFPDTSGQWADWLRQEVGL